MSGGLGSCDRKSWAATADALVEVNDNKLEKTGFEHLSKMVVLSWNIFNSHTNW